MIPTSEQVEEFCLGLGLVPVCGGFGEVAHYNPEEDKPIELDLNNLFRYAVPALAKKGWMCRVQYSPLRDNDTGRIISDWTGYASVYQVKGTGV